MNTTTATVKRYHPLAQCEVCPLYARGRYVPPEINGNKYVFVGEAPGSNEASQGRPFVGVSGKLLDEVMRQNNLKRSDSTLTNTVMCRPQGNAVPTAKAIAACKPALDATIDQADPDYVIALGGTAASVLMDKKVKITKERVGPPKLVDDRRYKLIPTVHPAACLRSTNLFPAFASDIAKLNYTAKITWEPPRFKVIDRPTQARIAISQLHTRSDTLVLDLEVGEDKDIDFGHPNTLLAAGIGYEPGKVVVLGRNALASNAVRRDLSNLLHNKRIVCQNGKYDLGVLHRMGIGTFKLHADTMLMSYTQNELRGTHSLEYMGQEHLGAPNWKNMTKGYDRWADIPPDILHRYNAYDVGVTWDLMELFQDQMDADDRKLHDFLVWASDQLMLIESEGMYVDLEALDRLEHEMSISIHEQYKHLQQFVPDAIDDNVYRLMSNNDGEYNPNSTAQTKGILETLTGATLTTTDKVALEWLKSHRLPQVRAFATAMLEWREITKLFGTYVSGTKRRLGDDGRIRSTFLLHGTETGRLSSRNPNVQNQPRGAKIRSIYTAGPGNVMLYGDYRNIEGRIVCHLAQSERMHDALAEDRDIHSEVAAMFYGGNFTKEQRVLAKSVVHGANYARTAEGIAEGLGVSVSEAKKVYNTYHKLFPEVKVWHAAVKHQVLHTDDPLITPWGRKRRFGLITRDNSEDVYKEGLAFKPQSIGSDICLTAAIRLKEQGVSVRNLVHDGILVECPQGHEREVAAQMERVMIQAGEEYTDYVKFPVDIQVGRSWGDMS